MQISIDKNGQLFWDDTAITFAELDTRFAEQGRLAEPPTIQLCADQDSRYDTVAQVLATASQNQLTKIAFVNDL
ncbi:ExbD/TolR family protein [Faucicola atlantae]|uniref:ExbD/TolR family protein n=1 Tax=Faucicola atlantae TaxID=34059 RepID=UPI0025B0E352|nr:biopolymer transporter ExbD [Moraxella atlantae]